MTQGKYEHEKGKCTNTGKTHFKKGYAPWNKGVEGENSSSWKYGSDIYWMKQARKTFEQVYGIPWEQLNKPEQTIIHHIDGDKSNNEFENLCIMERKEHIKVHNLRGCNYGI